MAPASFAGPVSDWFEAAPVLRSSAATSTSIYREVLAGDHTIVLLRMHAVGRAALTGLSPLVFHRSRFGRLEPR